MNALHLVTETSLRDLTPGHHEPDSVASASVILTWHLVRPALFPSPRASAERSGEVIAAGRRAGWEDAAPWGHEALMWWAAVNPSSATDSRIAAAVAQGDGLVFHGLLCGALDPVILDSGLPGFAADEGGHTPGSLWRLYCESSFSEPLRATPLRQLAAAKDAAAGLGRVRRGHRRVYGSPWPTLTDADREWAQRSCERATERLFALCAMTAGPNALPRRWLARGAEVAFSQ